MLLLREDIRRRTSIICGSYCRAGIAQAQRKRLCFLCSGKLGRNNVLIRSKCLSWAEQSLDVVRIYLSEQTGLVSGSPKQHERPEKSGFHGNVQIWKGNHAVKNVPGHGTISVK